MWQLPFLDLKPREKVATSIAAIATEIPFFQTGLQWKAGIRFAEKAQAIRSKKLLPL
jgi:hypothetical protein